MSMGVCLGMATLYYTYRPMLEGVSVADYAVSLCCVLAAKKMTLSWKESHLAYGD
jgi:hypothetical protein